jgi:cation/acetate symporter
MSTPLIMFIVFIAITLGITYWAARRTSGTSSFFAANRQITGWQNGIAVAGDYMSAASFLGIAGLIAFNGYDGFMYSVGWLVAYLTVLLIVAEPLRNSGKYTMADVLAYRLAARPVRSMAALSTLTVSTFYMIAQMVGAGTLVALLLKGSGIDYNVAVIGVGILMIVYVVFGGMLATTWVQIIKAILLMGGTVFLSFLVLLHFGFDFGAFFNAATHVTYHVKNATTGANTEVTKNFLQPGLLYSGDVGKLDLISLGLALIFGTAGLPHILVRFYTVPDAKTARTSVVWAMALIGSFYIMTTFLGFGAATIVGRDFIAANGGTNMSGPLLAQKLAGDVFFAFISSIAFATILAVVAGLTISASTSFAHDFWTNVIHHGTERSKGEEVKVARVAAFVVGAVSILIAIVLGPTANVAFLVGLAFAVAASANLPVIIFSLFWKRFNTTGAVAGIATGLLASIILILLSPSFGNKNAIFPLTNPGILSIPLGFIGAYVGTMLSREPSAEEKFTELNVRANTGLGAEV